MAAESDRLAERGDEGVPPRRLVLDGYTFLEEEGRLRIIEPVGLFLRSLIEWGLLALGGVGVAAAMIAIKGVADSGWWLLIPAVPGVIGLWRLWLTISRGRTLWVFDRESGKAFNRGKVLRSLSSITHLGVFSLDLPVEQGGPATFYYAWLAPNQGRDWVPQGMLGLRKDVLGFRTLKGASQGATIIAAFLGVEVVSEPIG